MSNALKGRHEIVRTWWKALQPAERSAESDTWQSNGVKVQTRFFLDRGDRARLRRCQTIADAALQSSTWSLGAALGLEESDSEALLLVASVLAHVKEDAMDNRSLAYVLGVEPVVKDGKPRLSELRFQRLMRADGPNDFLQQLRRALGIAGGRADVATLADDLFDWSVERTYGYRRSSSVKFRWARDYYLKRSEHASRFDFHPTI